MCNRVVIRAANKDKVLNKRHGTMSREMENGKQRD